MKKGRIIILSGPSGSGKTTLYRKLLKSPKIKNKTVKSISVTTRARRAGEKDGRDYLFVSKKMFHYKKRNGHFLESERVFDNYYGTQKQNVLGLVRVGKNVLLCIDVQGAKTIKKQFPEAIRIFVKTASLRTLATRLKSRGSEGREHIRTRLNRARKELREAKDYDYVIINDHLGSAFRRLEAIVAEETEVA